MTEDLAVVADAARLSAVFIALWVGHMVGDHWVQTGWQVENKAKPGNAGRLACLAHVYTYTLTQVVAVWIIEAATNLDVTPAALTAGLAISAGTHYFADRRVPLRRLAALLDRFTGKLAFHDLGVPREGHDDNRCLGTGAYVLDQSWHIWWLFVAAAVMVRVPW
jgi:hypothetical protein